MLQRIDIVLKLENSFDYTEFVEACSEAGMPPLSLVEFAQKVGMLKTAMTMFLDASPKDAYLRFIQVMNAEFTQNNVVKIELKNNISTPCVSCGGGKVR